MRRTRTVLDLLTVLFGLVSLLAQWTVAIPPAGMPETFGYQVPGCWLAVAGLLASLLLPVRRAVIALVFTEAVLAAWFVWAAWTVTTPRFASLPFPFMATDVIGSGWFVAAAGLLTAAAMVVWEMRGAGSPAGRELWLLTALPGFGLMRLGRWVQGAVWGGLACFALYLASTDSPDATVFADYGRSGNVPPPFTRAPEWVLLTIALVLYAVTIALTIAGHREARSEGPA